MISLGMCVFFFWRQKKNQKDRRPIPIKSTLLTKNFTTRYRSDNKILLTLQAAFYRRVEGRIERHRKRKLPLCLKRHGKRCCLLIEKKKTIKGLTRFFF